MKQQHKILINNMRLEGHTPSAIAAALGIPAGTVRSYIHRHPILSDGKKCPSCGKAIVQQNPRRPKKFCSDACRMSWWNTHQDAVNKKAFYELNCNYCGKEFESYGNKNRKFCSRACYDASRQAG